MALKIFFSLCFLFFTCSESFAQFNIYRSRSKFNTDEKPAIKPLPEDSLSEEDMMDPADAQIIKEATEASTATPPSSSAPETPLPTSSRFSAPPSSVDASDSMEQDDEDEVEDFDSATFGSRPAADPKDNKNPQYVNLNPETAFGPEIVQSFDFPDTDIMELTKHMQKLTGINLILDKDVKGKVSIIAPTAITVGDAWKAYLTALNMAGYTLVKSGAFYKVINARDIRYTPTKIYTGNYTPDTENYVMRVIALKNVSAGEIARNFRPFMSRYGRIIDIKQTNTVIMADTGTNINRLVKMVKFLDVPGHEESLQIVKVKNSSAQEIAKLLDSILKGGSGGSSMRGGAAGGTSARFAAPTGESSSASSISRIIAEPRTNSIIAMANAEGARQLRDLINKLDVKLISGGSGRVHVYYLNYGDSEELSKTLSSIVTGNVAKDGGAAGGIPRFNASSSNDSPIFTAEVKITSDKNNNALVVTASPTDWLTLKDVISRLDIPRDQVYVEGLIIEANIKKDSAFGVQFAGAYGTGNAQRAGFGGGDLWKFIGGDPTSLSGFFAGAGIGPSREVTLPGATGPTKINGVNALIKAVASHQNSNVLATPQILALDNTEATFEVGDTVPTRNGAIGQGGIQSFNVTQQEAKLSLKITPQINKVTRFVKLKINQRIDDFKPVDETVALAGGGVPTQTRTAQTEVMVKDRDTIAMGGLLRDKEVINFSKVPILGDIPVLGWLFKSKSRTIEKVNLLFFMTPKIIAPYDKTASNHTLEVLEKRENSLKGVFDTDDVDPNKKKLKELNEKVQLQTKGPLYDQEDADYYKNLNDRALKKGTDFETSVEEPNYQEILEEVKRR